MTAKETHQALQAQQHRMLLLFTAVVVIVASMVVWGFSIHPQLTVSVALLVAVLCGLIGHGLIWADYLMAKRGAGP